MSVIIGIDLGTTFSVAAKLDETGRPVIVKDIDEGTSLVPSVVTFTGENATIVGVGAEKRLGTKNTIGRFKRELGTATTYETDWGNVTPQQLSSLVLQKIKAVVEKESSTQITEAVVTIPANFSNEAREATLAAAKSAGLKIRHIINEPTAAALFFAHSSGQDLAGVYAIFDLGGGTFDVTIIRVNGQDIEVLATEGVSRLGGDDFDNKIIELLTTKYQAQTSGTIGPGDISQKDAEDVKKDLSRSTETTTRVVGSAGRADIKVTRDEFEEAISTYLAQIILNCETVIEDADVRIEEIQAVILAGGSTRIPAVQNAVKKVFQSAPVTYGNPDETIALGAALYAAYKTDASNLNPIQRNAVASIKLSEIAPKYFGTISLSQNQATGSEELKNSIVIRKGEKLPVSVTETFYTIRPDQTEIDCTVTEANSPETDQRFVRIIWEGSLGPLPSGRPAEQPVEVTFAYDTNSIMHCTFKDVQSGLSEEVELSLATKKGDDGFNIERFTVE